ncbi:5'-3' DNA helicase ZGRF1 isoform X2 [Lissotriton helveticus]
MTCQEFTVLYTHQKTKKSKVWQDGSLKIAAEGNKANLFDDKGQRLESVFLKDRKLCPGDDLESDRYLITVEAQKNGANVSREPSGKPELPSSSKSDLKPISRPMPRPLAVGLKRKTTGFLGPRPLPCKDVDHSDVSSSSSAKRHCTALPSQLYHTSPLFAAPYGKNMQSNFQEEVGAFVKLPLLPDDGQATSPSALFSPSHVDPVEQMKLNDEHCNSDSIVGTTGQERSEATTLHSTEFSRPTGGMGISHHIRSKAQILALLNSKPNMFSTEVRTSEFRNSFSNHQDTTAADLLSPVERKTKENMQRECQSGDLMSTSISKKSKWDVYLPKHSKDASSNNNKCTLVDETKHDHFDHVSGNFSGSNAREEFLKGTSETLLDNNHRQIYKDSNIGNEISSSPMSSMTARNPFNYKHYADTLQRTTEAFESNINMQLETSTCSSSLGINLEGMYAKESLPDVSMNENVSSSGIFNDQMDQKADTCYRKYNNESLCENNHMHRSHSENVSCGSQKPPNKSAGEMMKEQCIISDGFNDTDDEFSEITFNLMDSFDFDNTEEEDSQATSMPAYSSEGTSREEMGKPEDLTSKRDPVENGGSQGEQCLIKSLPLAENLAGDSISVSPVIEDILHSPDSSKTPPESRKSGKAPPASISLVDYSHSGTEDFSENTNVIKTISTGDKNDADDHSVSVDSPLLVDDDCDRASVCSGRCESKFEELAEAEPISISSTSETTSVMSQGPEEVDLLAKSNNHVDSSLWNSWENNNLASDNLVVELPLEAKDSSELHQYVNVEPSGACTWLDKMKDMPAFSTTSQLAVERGHDLLRVQEDMASTVVSARFSDLGNGIGLLRSLGAHSTALESLKHLEEETIGVVTGSSSVESRSDCARGMEGESPTNTVSSPEDLHASPCLHIMSPHEKRKFIVIEEKEHDAFTSLAKSSKHFQAKLHSNGYDARISRSPSNDDRGHPKCSQQVEFQGYKVNGSASSVEMVRDSTLHQRCNQQVENSQQSNFTAGHHFMTPELSGRYTRNFLVQSPDLETQPALRVCLSSDERDQNVSSPTEAQFAKVSLYCKTPQWMLTSSNPDWDLDFTQWPACDTSKEISLQQHVLPHNPDVNLFLRKINKELPTEVQEKQLVNHKVLPSDQEDSECFFEPETFEKLEDDDDIISGLTPRFRTLLPIITVPPAGGHIGITSDPEVDCEDEPHRSVCALESGLYGQPVRHSVRNAIGQASAEKPKVENLLEQSLAAGLRSSKWMKYQSTAPCDSSVQEREHVRDTDNTSPKCALGAGSTGHRNTSSEHFNIIKDRLGEQHGAHSVSKTEILSLNSKQPDAFKKRQSVLERMSHNSETGARQNMCISELSFPSETTVENASLHKRQILIPTSFQSPSHYKQVFTAVLTEHLNILLFNVSQRFHAALSKADISFYTSAGEGKGNGNENFIPFCLHHQPAKLIMVKKEGRNKGRFFFTCDAPKANQCNFFKWLDEVKSSNAMAGESKNKVVLCDIKSVGSYIRCQRILLYEECQLLVRKPFDYKRQFGKFRKNMKIDSETAEISKSKLYLKLSKKENASLYSKDDLWVVSKTLNFDPLDTFIACSAFYGPSAISEVELLPLQGYYPSNWPANMIVHALLVGNASSELTTLRNIQEHFNPTTLPIMPYLLQMTTNEDSIGKVQRRKFVVPAMSLTSTHLGGLLASEAVLGLAKETMDMFNLNMDQAAALVQIGQMMTNPRPEAEGGLVHPITLLHGVFGAGKSYLLAVVVLFLVQLFEKSEAADGPRKTPWKLLISSSTNVAVDRVLLGLLELGFDKFIRVGSVRKIAKPILPYSLHAGSGSDNEQLKELLSLMKEDITPAEKVFVRRSIEQHKLGTNKKLLGKVRVVGVTCAACPFPCLNNLRFPVVVLDECSQITEPASLLPIARFECEKLLLVGDPKQLPPTIQGSDCAHEKGLEQTLFDRLCLMGHKALLLRTQYRCHPAISAIVNDLFYEGNLVDGVTAEDRHPLLDWLPTLCFYNVKGTEQIEQDNSFHNMEEAVFTCKLIQTLIASGIEGSMIGVITLYRSQMFKLCNLLCGAAVLCDPLQIKAVQVSTVDAFQGAEKEIIVLSCVRSRQVGFIDSEKRMNVALTRGKRHLLIVGNVACLRKNKLWGRVIHHCEEKENGLKDVSHYEEELKAILSSYMERKSEEDATSKKRKSQKNFS